LQLCHGESEQALQQGSAPSSRLVAIKAGVAALSAMAEWRLESPLAMPTADPLLQGLHALAAQLAANGAGPVDTSVLRHAQRLAIGLQGPLLGALHLQTLAVTEVKQQLALACHQLDSLAGPNLQVLRSPRPGAAAPTFVSLAAQGDFLATGHEDGTMAVWSLQALPYRMCCQWQAHRDAVTALAFGAQPLDGERRSVPSQAPTLVLWSGGCDSALLRHTLQLETWARRSVETKTVHAGWVRAVAVAPAEPALVSGCGDGILRLFDASRPALVAQWQAHEHWVTQVRWLTPELVLSSGADCAVCLTAVVQDRLLPVGRVLLGKNWVNDLAVLNAGRVATACSNGDVTVWSLAWDLPEAEAGRLRKPGQMRLTPLFEWQHGAQPGPSPLPRAVALAVDHGTIVSMAEDGSLQRRSLVPGSHHAPVQLQVPVTANHPRVALSRGRLCIAALHLHVA
jgi:hypothetical protein